MLAKEEPVCSGPLSDEEKDAMKQLKINLMLIPVLELPRLTGKCTIDTEACDRKVRCVIL